MPGERRCTLAYPVFADMDDYRELRVGRVGEPKYVAGTLGMSDMVYLEIHWFIG